MVRIGRKYMGSSQGVGVTGYGFGDSGVSSNRRYDDILTRTAIAHCRHDYDQQMACAGGMGRAPDVRLASESDDVALISPVPLVLQTGQACSR